MNLTDAIAWLALVLSAVHFIDMRRESRRQKGWLVRRLLMFRSDFQVYVDDLKKRQEDQNLGFPFLMLAQVPLWTQMKLDKADAQLLSELDDKKLLSKGEAGLGMIVYALERWYTQPVTKNEYGRGCFIIKTPADATKAITKLEGVLGMLNEAILKLESFRSMIW